MPTWSTLDMLRNRLPHHVIDGSSVPSQTTATGWLDYAEARMRSVLAAQGLRTTYSNPDDADAVLILAEKAVDYGEGRFRRAKASLEGDDENLDGQILVESFEDFIDKIEEGTVLFGAQLEGGDVAEGQAAFRSHVTDLAESTADDGHRVRMAEVLD